MIVIVTLSGEAAMADGTQLHYKALMTEDKLPLAGTSGVAAAEPGSGILPLERFVAALPHHARLIGIDVGTKTLGLAISDVSRMIASALLTIRRTKFKDDAQRLLEIAAAQRVGGYVVGLPLNLDGSQGARAQSSRAFARNLAALTGAPILLWDERLSTAEAERMLIEADASRQRRAEVIDKVAATIILQGALDRMRSLKVGD